MGAGPAFSVSKGDTAVVVAVAGLVEIVMLGDSGGCNPAAMTV